MNPRSADVYAHKNKVFQSQQKYRPPSDQDDVSTNVSSRSQIRRNHVASVNGPIQYNHNQCQPVSHTPQASLGKAHDLHQNYHQDIRGSQNSNYDMYEPVGYKSKLGYRRQMESAGISRALGMGPGRYEGVGNVLRMAREVSKENIALSSNQALKMERGPRP